MRAVNLLLLVTIAAAGIAALTPHSPAFPPPGRLVAVDGARLHIDCTGEGGPTVVLEPDLGGTTLAWSWLQPELAQYTRVCSYDRPGLGWSDPLEMTRDGRSQARLLHKLLAAAGEKGPFVFAGHSLGGAYARIYRDLFRSEVQGIILLDSIQSGYCERMPGAAQSIHELASRLALSRQSARLHLAPLLLPVPASVSQLPHDAGKTVEGFLNSPAHLEAMQMEAEEWMTTMAQVGEVRPIRKLPLLVLSSQVSGGCVRREWMPYWREMQKDLGMLSDQSRVMVVPGSNHETMLSDEKQAQWVSGAIMEWLCSVSM